MACCPDFSGESKFVCLCRKIGKSDVVQDFVLLPTRTVGVKRNCK